ncbi:MAG: hypothetical protein MJD61_07900 [Proteobacteria bacterium]|nr:hypothetical protein [Pseudomonadota bacterium]
MPDGAKAQSAAGYMGVAGETRAERVHVPAADGGLDSVEIYRCINVATDPELKERALEGRLHRLADGRELAVPFVYHDPASSRFALVVPSVLAYRELPERAQLLCEVARETAHAIPAYVRACPSLVGLDALRSFLEQAPQQQPGPRQASATQTASEPTQPEPTPRPRTPPGPMHESVEWTTQITEGELHEVREALNALDSDDEVVPPPSQAPERHPARGSLPPPIRSAPPGLGSRPGSRPPPLHRRAEAVPPPLHLTRRSSPVPRNDGPTAALSAPQGGVRSAPPPLPRHDASRDGSEPGRNDSGDSDSDTYAVAEPTHVEGPQPGVAPPPSFFDTSGPHLAAVVAGEELWLFARMEPSFFEAHRPQTLELWVQGIEAQGCPLVVVVLGEARSEASRYLLRVPLALHERDDRRVIDALVRAFEARVALYRGERYQRTIQVRGHDRGTQLRHVLERLDQLPRPMPHTSAAAMARLRSDPPPFEPNAASLLLRTDAHGRYSAVPSQAGSPAARAASTRPAGSTPPPPPTPAAARADAAPAHPSPPVGTGGDGGHRLATLLTMCRKRDPAALPKLLADVQELTIFEAAQVFAATVGFGGSVLPVLLEGLSETSPAIRQLSMLAIGELGDSRAVVPMLQQLRREPTEAWREAARALGCMGSEVFKAIDDSLDLSDYEDRHVLALAHLSNRGALSDLQKMEKGDGQKRRNVARKALAVRGLVRSEDRAVRSAGVLPREDEVKRLSQGFYAALHP